MCTVENGLMKLQLITGKSVCLMYARKVSFLNVVGPVYLKYTMTAILSSWHIASYSSFICFGDGGEFGLFGLGFFRIFNCL